ncbi:hypothetical protein [Rhizobium ruizarguesonis]|uniref:hypothetical protein n=1 Tax=Rhizobium ruizarguesonis TaxID=2081791 RepID=UPI003716C817
MADLVAIGPQIVCVGEFLGAERGELNFRLRSFVDGDIHALLAFVDHFQDIRPADRYILVDELGDGRVLSGPLSVKKEGSGGYTIQCPVLPSAARINASELPMDPALSDTHDLFVAGGDLATVSGFTALPQRLKICLSHQAGESRFSPDFGTRFGAYYRLLTGSPWFGHFLKLEVIRMAAIPYHDASLGGDQTPLRCVERVFAIDLLAGAPEKRWLPIRLDLQVKGVGRWQHELKVYIPDEPLESAAAAVTGARSRA